MRICFIADGRSEHTLAIANHFALSNHHVYLISPKFIDGYDPRVIKYRLATFLPGIGTISYLISFPTWVFQIKNILSKIKPDIIGGHFITVYGFLASLSGYHPFVSTAWGSDILIHPQNSLFWREIAKSVLKKTDYLICLFDDEILDAFKRKLIPENTPVAFLPRGIDTTVFNKTIQKSALKELYGIGKNETVIINIRGSSAIYDPVTFLKSIPIVLKNFPDTKFVVTYRPDHTQVLIKMIKELGIERNITILDWIPGGEVAKLMAIADIYVSTSLSDGASNSLLEGMSCELAPVVTDIPANRAWIDNNENGFLFDTGDYKTLAEKIVYLIKDEKKRLSFGKICRQIVTQRGEFKNQMEKMENIYSQLINKCPYENKNSSLVTADIRESSEKN
jgi:glycosyltransferase involved in cell wall biosynthesis